MENDFSKQVYDIVRTIPAGKVLTYGVVARLAGNPGAARAVGTLLGKNTDLTIPCHRVIRSDGKLGAYNGLRGKSKEELLRGEGYVV